MLTDNRLEHQQIRQNSCVSRHHNETTDPVRRQAHRAPYCYVVPEEKGTGVRHGNGSRASQSRPATKKRLPMRTGLRY